MINYFYEETSTILDEEKKSVWIENIISDENKRKHVLNRTRIQYQSMMYY